LYIQSAVPTYAYNVSLIIAPSIRDKLSSKVPPVTREEIEECFQSYCGVSLVDDREDNATNPPTRWFIGETNFGRKLKISFVKHQQDIHIKSAYTANQKWIEIYNRYVNGG